MGSTASLFGIACAELVFSLSLVEAAHLEPLALTRSSARPDPAVLALGTFRPDLSPPPRNHAHPDPAAPASKASRLGFLLLVPGMGNPGLSLFPRSLL